MVQMLTGISGPKKGINWATECALRALAWLVHQTGQEDQSLSRQHDKQILGQACEQAIKELECLASLALSDFDNKIKRLHAYMLAFTCSADSEQAFITSIIDRMLPSGALDMATNDAEQGARSGGGKSNGDLASQPSLAERLVKLLPLAKTTSASTDWIERFSMTKPTSDSTDPWNILREGFSVHASRLRAHRHIAVKLRDMGIVPQAVAALKANKDAVWPAVLLSDLATVPAVQDSLRGAGAVDVMATAAAQPNLEAHRFQLVTGLARLYTGTGGMEDELIQALMVQYDVTGMLADMLDGPEGASVCGKESKTGLPFEALAQSACSLANTLSTVTRLNERGVHKLLVSAFDKPHGQTAGARGHVCRALLLMSARPEVQESLKQDGIPEALKVGHAFGLLP